MLERNCGLIRGMPLIKFQDERIIELIQGGSIRMNSLSVYREMYKNSGDEIIGDPYEGKLCIHEADVFIPELGIYQKINNQALSTVSENDFVFCMIGVNLADCRFQFSNEQKQKFTETYDTALIITDSQEFTRRIRAQINSVQMRFVQYYDEKADDAGRLCQLLASGMDSIAFHKRDKYAYQQEFRYVLSNRDPILKYFDLNIGDIHSISKAMSSKEAIKIVISEKQ